MNVPSWQITYLTTGATYFCLLWAAQHILVGHMSPAIECTVF